jgi:hypothetical protein
MSGSVVTRVDYNRIQSSLTNSRTFTFPQDTHLLQVNNAVIASFSLWFLLTQVDTHVLLGCVILSHWNDISI